MQSFVLSVSEEPLSVSIDPDAVILRSTTIVAAVGDNSAPSIVEIRSLRPNPASNTLAIEYDAGWASNVEITVYDVTGRPMLSRNAQSPTAGTRFATLNTSSLPAGVYFLRMSTLQGQASQKFVVVR
jgi:hypothetical protein